MLGREGLEIKIKGVPLDVFLPLYCNASESDMDVALAVVVR